MRDPLAIRSDITSAEAERDRLVALVPRLEAEVERLPTLLVGVTELWVPSTWDGPAARRGHSRLIAQREKVATVVATVVDVIDEVRRRVGFEDARLDELWGELAGVEARLAAIEVDARARQNLPELPMVVDVSPDRWACVTYAGEYCSD